ncbi:MULTISPECIES: hypothetical protein [Flavobacteriaceae]|uniref:hypothetical protein n=1 Tax=Flavobacteriaceae TaxID=49546 RepID=UPI003A8DBC96
MTATENKTIHEMVFSCETKEQKKDLLRSLSKSAKMVIEAEQEDRRVNEVLMDWYTNDIHNEFHNFWEWKKLGFKVKKGERAFFVWGKKRKVTEKAENSNEEDKEFKFYPIAYLFSNAQVEPLKKAEND